MSLKQQKTKQRVKIQPESPMLAQLNDQQKSALSAMQAFLKSDAHFFLLKGYAGTGKTFTIQALIQKLQTENRNIWIACAAPTHKAVKVLRNMADTWKIENVDFATIYQLLGLTLDYDEEGGRTLVEGRDSKLKKYKLVILDEASMVSSKLWQLLSTIVPKRNVKVICMGDPAQLPPVHEIESPVFTAISAQAELTQIMRNQTENPISTMIQTAREQVFTQNCSLVINSNFSCDQSQGVWVLEKSKWLQQMVKAFQSPTYQKNPDYVRAIAWTNKTVDYLNHHIRHAIYEHADQPYVAGERLIAKDTIFDPYEEEETILMNASAECEVISASYSNSGKYHVWRLKVVDEEGSEHILKVLDASSYEKFQTDLSHHAEQAQIKKLKKVKNPWEDYWTLRNRYAQVNYAYAMTSHKGQGSTFQNVFVAQKDILRNPNEIERYKSLYVAYSRASDRLIIQV
ncbi:ATP-dependent RecD-like DNA helicase [Chroococcus sp. FPU101]|uniref:ATP-dependent DNA helicase n=1 Tax=Chroococcus sp. FPU101 TaxID=1974212 RepID=UPI001A90AFD6|nr:AAA family ATPase [Chroococcus sp. FPU101]GFE68782.1 DNA helicase, putative [Chroococcus sp. FPU101]